MKALGQSVKNYFNTTHTLLYSYLISLPLLLAYEILIYISQPASDQVVRISVDVWVKTLFSYFSHDVLSITLIVAALLGIFVVYKERERLSSLKPAFFMGMLLEATAYAFLLSLIISSTVQGLLQILPSDPIEQLGILQQFALSLGAGLYEELFFRVILVSTLLFIFKRVFSKKFFAISASMILAAIIFSLVHFVGALGDDFSLGAFLFRFLFGLALNGLYIWRGFGMAAWTHAIYDIMVLT